MEAVVCSLWGRRGRLEGGSLEGGRLEGGSLEGVRLEDWGT